MYRLKLGKKVLNYYFFQKILKKNVKLQTKNAYLKKNYTDHNCKKLNILPILRYFSNFNFKYNFTITRTEVSKNVLSNNNYVTFQMLYI